MDLQQQFKGGKHPLAAAEKLLQVPSGDSMCSLLKATDVAGLRMLEAPPTIA